MSGDTVPAVPCDAESAPSGGPDHGGAIAARARTLLDAHWRPRGYTVPNAQVYPHQWLWDSCFHAVVWARLGAPDRAVAELGNVFARQHADGFVPHMTYWEHPQLHAEFWGRSGESSITQPPMYGHALAELVRRGVAVDPGLVRRAVAGLRFLLGPRRGDRELVPILHPWESGCDDSPRWDRWAGPDRTPPTWRARKGELVASLVHSPSGSSVANPGFEVEAASFNALVAFNVAELASVGLDGGLAPEADALAAALDRRWDPERATWRDTSTAPEPGRSRDGAPGEPPPARTLEALLPVLVTSDGDRAASALAQVVDDAAFGGRFGPAQVHRAEPTFDPEGYWRGPAWPQLTYLFWVAARRRGVPEAGDLAARLVAGAERSGFAEYWHPDTGHGLGAVPQSWAALAAVVTPPG